MAPLTVADLFEKAISWEIAARDLYTVLSKAFPTYPDVEETWHLMAVDESMHASILRQARDAMPEARLSEQLVTKQTDLVEAVDGEFARAGEAALETLDDVYELAHQLESSEVNTVFLLLVSGEMDDASRAGLMKSQFDEHLGRLTRLADTYDRQSRRSIAVQT